VYFVNNSKRGFSLESLSSVNEGIWNYPPLAPNPHICLDYNCSSGKQYGRGKEICNTIRNFSSSSPYRNFCTPSR
jgi:hypothetical protein